MRPRTAERSVVRNRKEVCYQFEEGRDACVPLPLFFEEAEAVALKIFIEELLVVIGADDVRAVAVELHPDGIMDDADRDIAEIIIRDASQHMELGQNIRNVAGWKRFPSLIVPAPDFFEIPVQLLILSKSAALRSLNADSLSGMGSLPPQGIF